MLSDLWYALFLLGASMTYMALKFWMIQWAARHKPEWFKPIWRRRDA